MKFTINKIHLWLIENEEHIEVEFQPNKINVITGDSNTGKTCLMKILDYCLFSKKNDIPDDINEKVFAYGLSLTVKDRKIAIARETNGKSGSVSQNYLFTDDEEKIPLVVNREIFGNYSIPEKEIKSFLEKKEFFGISETFQLLPKGNKIRSGSTLNLSYFFIYNTISQNIIINENSFFDFELNNRDRDLYEQALDSIFDLSIGLSTEENYRLRQQINEQKKKQESSQKKIEAQAKRIKKDEEFVKKLIFKAKEYDLVDDEVDLNNIEEAFSIIKSRITEEYISVVKEITPSNYDELEEQRFRLTQKIRTLKKFRSDLLSQIGLISKETETLKPIDYLTKNYKELISITEVTKFISNFKHELEAISKTEESSEPINYNTEEELKKLDKQLNKLEKELKSIPKGKKFINENRKSIFLIETKKDIDHFLQGNKAFKSDSTDLEQEIAFYTEEINKLEQNLPEDQEQVKRIRLELLNELIQVYLDEVKDCLDNYQNYKASFDYNKKVLGLRKESEDLISSIDGTSNFLFLQIVLFLGLHELFIKQGDKNYVPQFLFIDYPSLPYKSGKTSDESLNNDDREKLIRLFELLDLFIDKMTNIEEYGEDFQLVILEHVEEDMWVNNDNIKHFHLVKDFRDGNSLLNINKE